MTAINADAALAGNAVTSPTFTADGTGNLTLVNVDPTIAILVELRNISAALNTNGVDLNQNRANELYVLTVSGLGS